MKVRPGLREFTKTHRRRARDSPRTRDTKARLHGVDYSGGSVLRSLRLVGFRGFSNFRVEFGSGAYLVGPNNAGKSTILTALRLADVLLRQAQRRKPSIGIRHMGRSLPAYPIGLSDFPALTESIRYEFHNDEATLELDWKSGTRMVAVWPPEEDDEVPDAYFYLEVAKGFPVRDLAQARSIPSLGVIPVLTPIDHTERLLNDEYVRRNVTGRLSSRHFRNQLRLMQQAGTLDAFLNYADPWLNGMTLELPIRQRIDADGTALDLFYDEPGSRVPKELVWAGDGIQVWLQLLYHVYRVKEAESIVLDEPEVYLHPDLQRRLVHLLESTDRQVIVATHSSEIIAEASPGMATLVDRSRKYSRRAKDEAALNLLSTALGTSFNLRLARALRSSVALFVEGKDMAVLRRLAKILGLTRIVAEDGITVIPLEGYSRWVQVEPFKWLCKELLPEAINVAVILDRDYRTAESVGRLEASFAANDIDVHVWQRKELESYLLSPVVIGRLSGLPAAEVQSLLDSITISMENEVFGQLLTEQILEKQSASQHSSQVIAAYKSQFEKSWKDAHFRLASCPPKQVIAALNDALQQRGLKAVSVRSLASEHKADEIPTEMTELLRTIEATIS
jgi:hypothetical protein